MKFNHKAVFLSSCLVASGVQATASIEISDPQEQNSVSALKNMHETAERFTVELVQADCKEKISKLEIEKPKSLKEAFPTNLWRTSFNGLQTEESKFIELENVQFCRPADVETSEFTRSLPTAAALFSNTAYPLTIQSARDLAEETTHADHAVRKNFYEITYTYHSTLNYFGAAYEIKVWALKESVNAHKHRRTIDGITQLENRIKFFESNSFNKNTIENKVEQFSKLVINQVNESSELEKITKDLTQHYIQLEQSFNSLFNDLHEGKVTSARDTSEYIALSWNLYQYMDILDSGINKFLKLSEGFQINKDFTKIQDFALELNRNLNTHYNSAVKEFANWCKAPNKEAHQLATFFENYLKN